MIQKSAKEGLGRSLRPHWQVEMQQHSLVAPTFDVNYVISGYSWKIYPGFTARVDPVEDTSNFEQLRPDTTLRLIAIKETFRAVPQVSAYLSQWQRDHPDGRFEDVLERSYHLYKSFRQRGLQGFSFIFQFDPRFNFPIRKDFGLRFGMLFDRKLFYPEKVARQLLNDINTWRGRAASYHMQRAIGFALGAELDIDGMRTWIITVLQSDLVKVSASPVRDYFRDWHKVLLDLILELAMCTGVKAVGVIPCSEVIRAAKYPPKYVPPTWERIYDQNALRVGMSKVNVHTPVNIQIAPDLGDCFTSDLFLKQIEAGKRSVALFRVSGAELSPLQAIGVPE